MHAVITTGGKQYRVKEGDVICVEKLIAETGSLVDFDKVLMIEAKGALAVGAPYLENSKVSAKIVSHGRAGKIEVLKFQRRKSFMRRQGHRQLYTKIQITNISGQ